MKNIQAFSRINDEKQQFVIATNDRAGGALFFDGFRSEQIEAELGDFIDCVRRATGVMLPLGGTQFARDCQPFWLRLDESCATSGDGFVVQASAQSLHICARSLAGLGNGLYWLLEKFAGVRWLWPGETGQVTPRSDCIGVPLGDYHEEPDYLWRRVGTGGPMWAPYSHQLTERAILGLGAEYQASSERWLRRNRFGGANIADGHRFFDILPPHQYGAEHPEYYALVNGKRDADWRAFNGKHHCQPCTSHPAVVEITADYIVREFERDASLDGFSIALNDGSGFCQCKLCRAQDEAETNQPKSDWMETDEDEVDDNSRILSRRMFNFVNAVAQRVAVAHPDKWVLMLVYSTYRVPPANFKLHPNVLAQFCTATNKYVAPEIKEAELDLLSDLADSAQQIAIYDYLEQGAWPGPPRLYPRLLGETLCAMHERGVRHYATQPSKGFATSGLNLYALGRFLWDSRADGDELLCDFYASGFGPAAQMIQRYFEAFEERWRVGADAGEAAFGGRSGASTSSIYQVISELYGQHDENGTPFLSARQHELTQARQITTGDEEIIARIVFLEGGLRFTQLVVEAAQTEERLQEVGLRAADWEPGSEIDWRKCEDTTHAATVIAASEKSWSDLLQWTDENAGKYLYPEFSFHYCYQSRGFRLLHNFVLELTQQL